MKKTDEEILQGVREQLRNSAGFDADKFAQQRKEAYKYYFQRPRGDEIKGRSQIVSGDVSAMVEATLSQMMDAFDSDRIAEFQALDAFDESQAQLEADTVQRLVMQGVNNGFLTFAASVKDALLERNGVIKVWAQDNIKKQTRTFEGVTVEALAEMKAALDSAGVKVEVSSFDADKQEATITTTINQQRLRVKALDMANFCYTEDWDGLDHTGIQEIPFCAERHVDTRSDLIKRGFDKAKVEALPQYHVSSKLDDRAKDIGEWAGERRGLDSSQQLVEWFECYTYLDEDGDGISERYRISVGSHGENGLLEKVPAPGGLVPYAVGIVILNPHRITGISLYDKLKQIQDKSTGLERALMDNVNAVVRSRLAYKDGAVNQDDMDSGRVNGDIRVRASEPDVRMAVFPIQVPDLTPGLLQNIQHQNSQRAEMGGAALDLATGNMQLNERLGSQGLDRAYSVMEQLSALMTKLIAHTLVRSVFLLAHATLRKQFTTPIRVKQHGRWRTMNPQHWPAREELTVRPGSSPNERARIVQALRDIMNAQLELAGQGMDDILLNVNSFHTAIMDWCRAQDIPNPEKYWLDPLSPESQQAMANKRAQAEAQAQAEGAMVQAAMDLEELRTAFDKYKQDTDLQFKYFEAVLNSEVEESKIVGKATQGLLTHQNGGNNAANGNSGNVGGGSSADDSEVETADSSSVEE